MTHAHWLYHRVLFCPRWLQRLLLLCYPPFFLIGIRLIHLSEDGLTCRVRLKYTWRTKNLFGSMFGGAMQAATDPFYVILLLSVLDPKQYLALDKTTTVEFVKPAYEDVYATFTISTSEIHHIQHEVKEKGKTNVSFHTTLTDKAGVKTFAKVSKIVHIRMRQPKGL